MAKRVRPEDGLGVYRRLLGYAMRYWRQLAVAVVAMAVFAATDTAFAALMKPLLDGSFVDKDPVAINLVPVALVLIFAIRALAGFLSRYRMSVVARYVVKELRSDLFAKLLQMPVVYFDTHSAGHILSKLTYNTDQVGSAASNGVTVMVRDSLTVIGLLGWMFYLEWRLTVAFLVVGPLMALLVTYVTSRFRRISRKIQDSMGEVTQVAEEVMEGQRAVKIYGGERYEKGHFEQANERNRRLNMKMAMTKAANMPLMQFLVALALAAIIFIATREPLLQSISVGTFMSFMTAMMLMLNPVRELANVNAILQRGIAAAQSIFDVLDSAAEPDRGTRRLTRAQGHIVYQDVHFAYDPAKGDVLHGVSLTVQPGEQVAFVGRSGSGKSTLLSLLPRFYEPRCGQVHLDGVDVRDYRLSDLRSQLAYVGQDVTLFNDTIRHNIAYGQLATASEAQIIQAVEAAHAMEFIVGLPEGLDTVVGDRGVLLSGGQRQRLAVARALLKDAPILILDEATSALDSEAERHIQAAIEQLVRNRTTLVIAHRLSTVEKADRIVVMHDGKVVENGQHRDLLERRGHYARLHNHQFHEPATV